MVEPLKLGLLNGGDRRRGTREYSAILDPICRAWDDAATFCIARAVPWMGLPDHLQFLIAYNGPAV